MIPSSVLERWSALHGRAFAPFGAGLINETFVVEGREARYILQRVHPLWSAEVHEDIRAVTTHLAKKGLATPRLVPTDDGALCVVDDDGRLWRTLTYVEGTKSYVRLASRALAEEAGALTGRVHRALTDLEHDYRFTRGNVHDTEKHLAVLAAALEEHRGHRLYDEVAAIARPLLDDARALPSFAGLPLRHVHGDLKVSNLLFDDDDKGVCVCDFDTLARMIWPFEMGDALRSWCNPGGEDQGEVRFDLALFEAAVSGYAREAKGFVTAEERALLAAGVMTITLELSARFLADALHEVYFGFDAERFPARGEHNLVRGRGQWELYQSVKRQLDEANAIVERAFSGGRPDR